MIRTTDELLRIIAQDIIWRKKELTELRGLIQSCNDGIRQNVLIRAAVSMLYAHWEGFVKSSSHYYLEFVASHRLSYRKLANNFVGLSLRAKFNELGVSEKVSGGNELADFFMTQLDARSAIPYRKGVDTKSNLSSKVLADIVESLGLNIRMFEIKFSFIDLKIVAQRNHIAHGESLDITRDEYFMLHDEVIALIELYRNEIENASVCKTFKAALE